MGFILTGVYLMTNNEWHHSWYLEPQRLLLYEKLEYHPHDHIRYLALDLPAKENTEYLSKEWTETGPENKNMSIEGIKRTSLSNMNT